MWQSFPVTETDARPPLLLLHGVTNSARIWDGVVPLLADDFDLIVPTAAGHRGGPPAHEPTTFTRLVDDVEALLDDRGLARVHVAGNSLGGWMAIELARRGRAASVCALSPAGFWTPGQTGQNRAVTAIAKSREDARRFLPIAPVALRLAKVRHEALRGVAAHGERVSPHLALEVVRDHVDCPAADDLLATTEFISPFDPTCPVTLVWAGRDRIFPAKHNGATAQRVLPWAEYHELPDVGHVPMLDDPALCAEVIRDTAKPVVD